MGGLAGAARRTVIPMAAALAASPLSVCSNAAVTPKPSIIATRSPEIAYFSSADHATRLESVERGCMPLPVRSGGGGRCGSLTLEHSRTAGGRPAETARTGLRLGRRRLRRNLRVSNVVVRGHVVELAHEGRHEGIRVCRRLHLKTMWSQRYYSTTLQL